MNEVLQVAQTTAITMILILRWDIGIALLPADIRRIASQT